MRNVYSDLDRRAFWRTGVVEAGSVAVPDLYRKRFSIAPEWNIATAGSCFAQHIAGHLMRAGYNMMNVEPAPSGLPEARRRTFGYSLYSGRYGNIYTVRQLRQLIEESLGEIPVEPVVWEKEGRFFDACRPAVEPEGLATSEEVYKARRAHLARLRHLFRDMDLFVFTMGMTETWEHVDTGRVVPIAPGVIAGEDRQAQYTLKNLSHDEVVADFQSLMHTLSTHRTKPLHYILTVSPVPITATASGQHALAASIYTKSVLRAAAGCLYAQHAEIDYFPGYEVVMNPAARGTLFGPNLRNVSAEGVDVTMQMFFSEHSPHHTVPRDLSAAYQDDLQCEEALLEAFGA